MESPGRADQAVGVLATSVVSLNRPGGDYFFIPLHVARGAGRATLGSLVGSHTAFLSVGRVGPLQVPLFLCGKALMGTSWLFLASLRTAEVPSGARPWGSHLSSCSLGSMASGSALSECTPVSLHHPVGWVVGTLVVISKVKLEGIEVQFCFWLDVHSGREERRGNAI